MAKSIRISDEMYRLAATQARLMHRSLAQQFEHWAALGQALEESGDIVAVQRASIVNRHALDRQRVRSGAIGARKLHVIPKNIARDAVLEFPDAKAFEDG